MFLDCFVVLEELCLCLLTESLLMCRELINTPRWQSFFQKSKCYACTYCKHMYEPHLDVFAGNLSSKLQLIHVCVCACVHACVCASGSLISSYPTFEDP